MSSKRLDTISDYARHGYRLRVECRSCQRVADIHPMEISLLCQRRNWSWQIVVIGPGLRCSKCSNRDVLARIVTLWPILISGSQDHKIDHANKKENIEGIR